MVSFVATIRRVHSFPSTFVLHVLQYAQNKVSNQRTDSSDQNNKGARLSVFLHSHVFHIHRYNNRTIYLRLYITDGIKKRGKQKSIPNRQEIYHYQLRITTISSTYMKITL